MKTYRTVIQMLMLSVLLSGSAYSQFTQSALLSATSDKTTVTNYYFARPNDLTFVVNVVGYVQRPGRYEIASTIDLLSLIALAGGPTADGDMSDVTVSRLIRDTTQTAQMAGDVNMTDLISITSKPPKQAVHGDATVLYANSPGTAVRWQKINYDLEGTKFYYVQDLQLAPGDMITVGRSSWSAFRTAAEVLTPFALVITVLLQIVTLTK